MNSELMLSCVADHYKCYPGDQVIFSVRLALGQDRPEARLDLNLADGLAVENILQRPAKLTPPTYRIATTQVTIWPGQATDQLIDYEITALVTHEIYQLLQEQQVVIENQSDGSPSKQNYIELRSQAKLRWQNQGAKTEQAMIETVVLHVYLHSAYLQYLPALYEKDSFLNHLLMSFERFWGPLQQQLDHFEDYFDPMLTPASLLPLLASWFDWTFEEDWPLDERQQEKWRRTMLHFPLRPEQANGADKLNFRTVLHLHRTRGTTTGMQCYLELYTQGKVEIQSFTLHPLRLDQTSQLGRGIALYQQAQQPHTFTITVAMPHAFGLDSGGKPLDDAQLATRKQQLTERIQRIVAKEKPAHTVLTRLSVTIEAA